MHENPKNEGGDSEQERPSEEQASAMEEAQERAAEERKSERGYQ